MPGSHAESPHGGRLTVPPTIDSAPYCGHDSSMRTSSRRAGAKVENASVAFSKAPEAPSFARAGLDARAPTQWNGLAEADHGTNQAALGVNGPL
jgi:hypothetical protein